MPDGVFNPYQSVLTLGQSNLPMILPGAAATSITVANGTNVAASLTTMATMPAWTSNQGVYVFLPVGALATSVPAAAGYFYGVVASTSAINVYNNPYHGVSQSGTGGTPTIPTTLNTWASITNGGITPTTGTYEVGYQYQVPGGTVIGINDGLRITSGYSFSGAASELWQLYAGTAGTTSDTGVHNDSNVTTNLASAEIIYMRNRGINTSQVWPPLDGKSGLLAAAVSAAYTTLNTANPFYLSFAIRIANVTNYIAFESVCIELIRGVA